MMSKIDLDITNLPDTTVNVREVFGIDSDITVPAYKERDAYVPDLDPDYLFDRDHARDPGRASPTTAG
jgi:cobaltochelatase CobS